MQMEQEKVTILGAGISGLATAYWLRKQGVQVQVLESRTEAGGSMQSQRKDGFLIDYGPNSGLDTTPLIGELVEELGLQDQVLFANQEAKKRYILKEGKLKALPTSPFAFLGTSLFSTAAKLRLLKEPFIRKTDPGQDVSIADFVRHRLGAEFLNNAIDPFISGIYAGDPEKLSVRAALPRLYALEEKYGSLIKGMISGAKARRKNPEKSKQSAQQFSFKEGMQILPNALAARMQYAVQYGCQVNHISREGDQYRVVYEKDGYEETILTPVLLTTIPAHRLKDSLLAMDSQLAIHLDELYYPPVMVMYLVFRRDAIQQPLDGFGFLIPGREGRAFLGAIWSSVIFPHRTDDQHAAFTVFVGGARNHDLLEQDLEVKQQKVMQEFKQIMKIPQDEDPVLTDRKMWSRAIPQYNIGYDKHEAYFQAFEQANPGFFLGGNFRGGISVSDCIKSSDIQSERILRYVGQLVKS
jgi:protoporphyrinogen/coproporphyrinogen III oxidase